MNRLILFSLATMPAFSPAFGDLSFPIEGTVDDACVAAVPTHPLHLHTTPGREDALACELRIRDDRGRNVPFVLRQRQIAAVEKQRTWHALAVTRVATSNDALVVEAEFPAGAKAPSRWIAFDVRTPLKDFEQTVRIFADGKPVCDGAICDYGKFADFRRTEISADCPFARCFTFVFAKPVSSEEAARFERTITERGDGTVAAREVRRSVAERPFRIDGLRVAAETTETRLRPAEPLAFAVAAEIERDARTKTTRLTVAPRGLPLTGVFVNTPEENFQRTVRVSRRRNNGWETFAEARIRVVSLPGKNQRSLFVGLNGTVRESLLRLEIEDGDSPSLAFDRLPVTFCAAPYDAVFIAHPERRYTVSVERGASRPSEDAGVHYLASDAEPVRLSYTATGSWGTPVDVSDFERWNPLPAVSVVVFFVLGFVCFRLFRSARETA